MFHVLQLNSAGAGRVVVTVTATGATPENSDAGPEHDHPHNAEKRTSAAVDSDACLGLSTRAGDKPRI
jgi:hypothetical protein